MASQKTKFAVGLFVAMGITLAILVTIWLGMSRFLQKGRFYVTYFDESVQGLDVDSPVKYRGVFTGRVESIGGVLTPVVGAARLIIVPADEHVRFSARKIRIDHVGDADDIEGLVIRVLVT